MKRFFIRTAKVLGILTVAVFLSAFIWANWSKPTLGERTSVMNFIPYNVSGIDSTKLAEIQRAAKTLEGVKVTSFNILSGVFSVGYLVDETDNAAIEKELNSRFNLSLKEKIFTQSGPKCPVGDVYNTVSVIRRTLCIRD